MVVPKDPNLDWGSMVLDKLWKTIPALNCQKMQTNEE